MQQEKIPVTNSDNGITATKEILFIRIDSNTPSECPIYGELHCIGRATISGVIKRFHFILPFVYETSLQISVPEQNLPFDVTSLNFSHMEIVDDPIITAMRITLIPYNNGLSVEFTPPSAGTWSVHSLCYIYKRLN